MRLMKAEGGRGKIIYSSRRMPEHFASRSRLIGRSDLRDDSETRKVRLATPARVADSDRGSISVNSSILSRYSMIDGN